MSNFPDLSQYPIVSLDSETTGLQWWKDSIFGFSVSAGDNDWYWDVRKEPRAIEWLRDEVRRIKLLTLHNAKFDWHFFREVGVEFVDGRVHCSMIRAALIDEHRLTYDLDSLARDYTDRRKTEDIYEKLAELFGGKATKHAQITNLPRAPVALAGRYAKDDTRAGLHLWHAQEKLIVEQDLQRVHDLEMNLLPRIVRMERRGVRVNVLGAEKAVEDLDRRTKVMQRELDKQAGFAVNPNPSGSIKKLFQPEKKSIDGTDAWQWVAKDGTILQSTEAGAPSLDADALRAMTDPAAAMILSLRKLIKARDTFLKGHVLSNHDEGIIHANYNQTKSEGDVGTSTGRLSVNSPALQQIPKRDKELGEIVRSIFVPDNRECDWVCNDWAQMDFRVFSHYVRDPTILKMYEDDPDSDFHKIAAGLTGLPRSASYAGEPNAKQINLGLVFGMGKGQLAAEMHLPYTIQRQLDRDGKVKKEWKKPGPEAEAVFEKYHSAIPGVGRLLENASSVAKSRGHVLTMMGRRIRFPRGMFVHKAGGLIFQGTAADALKVKLCELDDYLESTGCAHLLLNVHDEFDTNVPKGREDIRQEISRIVTKFDGIDTPMKFRVPIRTDQGVADNWWDACK